LREAPSADSEGPDDEKKAARARDREARDEIRRIIDVLIAEYAAADRGIEIREVAGGFRMATRAEYHDAVRAFVKTLKPPMKLSLQALETLAVIAYKQPVTAPEIGEIRGVDSGGVLGSLVARKLITTAGRKQVIGRPILYKTTKEFLLRFGLKDIGELPSIEEFEKMASELAESEEEAAAIAPSEEELPFAENEAADAGAETRGAEARAEAEAAGDAATSEGEAAVEAEPTPHSAEEPQP
jgi:segregation and condensation protein B